MKITHSILLIFLISGLFLISCGNNKSNSEANKPLLNKKEYLKKGKDFALQTKSNLAKYLIPAIDAKGPEGAVEFCNAHAMTITDSMSKVLLARLKRVSDKPRNPNNLANIAETAYINKWKVAKAKGKKLGAEIFEINGKMVGYYPIVTHQMCMQCHGSIGEEISAATQARINELYPEDKATNYDTAQIRGIFVVEMDKE